LLEEEIFVRVFVSLLFKIINDVSVKGLITNSIGFDTWEEIVDKTLEKWYIIIDELWNVHISQSSHEHNVFWKVRVLTLQLTSHDKH
jgi:hypothetical protein